MTNGEYVYEDGMVKLINFKFDQEEEDKKEKEFADWCQSVEEAFEALEENCKGYESWGRQLSNYTEIYNRYVAILVKAGRRK